MKIVFKIFIVFNTSATGSILLSEIPDLQFDDYPTAENWILKNIAKINKPLQIQKIYQNHENNCL